MMPVDFNTLAQQCAPAVHASTLQAIVRTESGFQPYAIGVVGGRLVRQPHSRDEAVATVKALDAAGWNYSVGLSQVNRANLGRYGLTGQDAAAAFDPCANLRAGSAILADCYRRASARMGAGQQALRAAFSCYYSGNFQRGFTADSGARYAQSSYVQRVVANALPAPAGVTNTAAVTDEVQAQMALQVQTEANAHVNEPASAQAIPVVPAVTPESGLRGLSGQAARTVRPAPLAEPPAPGAKERAHATWDTFGDF
jgi:type IV secretion system protein VirB1